MSRALPFVVALMVPLVSSAAQAQRPEERGPLAFSVWDAGRVPADATTIPTRVYYPDAGGPYPLVGVIHGANATGAYHVDMASVLASRGFVAVVPDMPCTIASCDHAANQRQISALLEWATAQGADPSSRLSGLVDGTRRGLIGHSWGGLSSHLTAARDPSIDSLVLLDANDDAGMGLAATPTIVAPVLQLIAETEGSCNSAWREAMVRAALTTPNLQVQPNGSGHCNPGEMDFFCSAVCGSGDPATTAIFRRYAVAWTACVLAADPAMADWVGGALYDADVAGGILENAFPTGLEALPCRGGTPFDAGPGTDAGTTEADSGPAGGIDGGDVPATDGGAPPGTDGGPVSPPAPLGCGCHAAGRGTASTGGAVAGLLATILAACRRRTPL